MKLGVIYAGQGSQKVGMGADFYENSAICRDIYDNINLPFDVKEISFTDSEGLINRTKYTQPAMVAFALSATAVLKEKGITPSAVLGLSLGEYSALAAAGVWNAQTAIELVAFRGEAMEKAVEGLESAMYAVLELEREKLNSICEKVSAEFGEVVSIANYNCPGQLVIAGEKRATDEVAKLAKEEGARRCLPLKVSGPFHTALLKPAGDALEARFENIEFNEPNIDVFYNCLGGKNSENISTKELLVRQVQSSVYLEDSLREMLKLNLDGLIEIGPGKVLAGFMKKISPETKVYNIEKLDDIDAILAEIEV